MSSRRGGRGSRNPRDLPRDQQVSRKVSWLLRHGAQQEGLTLGKGGYVNVNDALNTRALKSLNITFAELRTMVAENDKQRFSMIPVSSAPNDATDPPSASEALASISEADFEDPADFLIRANQGHSIKLDTEGLLTPITEDSVPDMVVHGTDEKAWRLILKSGGLRRMARNHIHFASGLPKGFKPMEQTEAGDVVKDAPPVISGMRNSSTVLVYLDIQAAMASGIKFYRSENGVILTEGDDKGFVPYQFFKRVENRKKGGGVLMKDGVLPDGVEVNFGEWEKEVGAAGGGKGGRKGGKGRGGGKGGGKSRVNDDSCDLFAGT
ncbi:hypothetical protein K469DRAFT_711102 [Zopfia rhizophila CBS 207.26]|uniref:2'-phosphotransferase n=1 Tax=Zopfia rhizophila CBS 207.26 TaxID=1314779 RepID=A0A6A6DU11_9PEZI|nr:hypothetical protein K469DRAFT_711102 [Zopfia rhizophila CBS 207.26]